MAFIRNITRLFSDRTITVEIDEDLLELIDSIDKETISRNIAFNLYSLIYHIGVLQSRLFASSNRLKFFDKAELIEKIHDGTNEFRIRINDIRGRIGSEDLSTISADFGIGISVVIAEALFNIRRSTIKKILGTGIRPDWKCITEDNRVLIVTYRFHDIPKLVKPEVDEVQFHYKSVPMKMKQSLLFHLFH